MVQVVGGTTHFSQNKKDFQQPTKMQFGVVTVVVLKLLPQMLFS